jgi:hypothetical protein
MKKIKILVVVGLLIISITGYAQNKTTLVVLKGSATIQKNTTEKVKLEKAHRLTLTNTATITLLANSSAIVYTSTSKIEIGCAKEQKLTYTQITALLKNTKQESLISSFVNYLEKMYQDIEEKNNSIGATVGGASRGIGDDNLNYTPSDEAIILIDTFMLSFGDDNTKLVSNILVTNETTNEVIYNDKPLSNTIQLFGFKSGHYNWTYDIENNAKTISFKNTFVIPTKTEKETKLKEIASFKASINNCKDCVTEGTKAILLNDFLETNNLYLK